MGPQPLFAAAAASYTANCALGASVALRLVDTSGFRWLHHAIYIATCVLAASAALTPFAASGPGERGRAPHPRTALAALALAPAAVPLALIPRISARSSGHVKLALTAAPFFVAGLLLSARPASTHRRPGGK
ncbi:hypothetical protein N1028_00460 [Herbiconiux sp. CPCC 203407]|uniref:Uncharacterized protein n=1 Tax=Herbiconiux oxytropis TaxID=2970915 RepID=A0AA41XEQ3_9MICO|nr:hypothetical protein [Herbiconiux oxytropis]MCS5720883.1 hypothetical protein [Herbiconiux oxytropis]MCS5724360.1 hypothetical protein [Herbiconiux oxytropis]